MAQREITVLKDVALITCVVQRGAAEPIINAARQAGAQGATVNFGKGMGMRERLGILGVAVEVEKEVIQVMVSTEQLDTPGMGIAYITQLEKAATYIPPEVLAKVAG